MANIDTYRKPKGDIQIVLHNGGVYDIKSNSFSPDAEIIKEIEIPNLIVSDASILMAMRMAPGKTTTNLSATPAIQGDVYDPANNDFVDFGLTHLALGTGSYANLNLGINKLDNEICRKPFNAWSFILPNGNTSSTPTNILKLSTTFTNDTGLHQGGNPAPITEMGLFGGTKDRLSYVSSTNPAIEVNEKDGGIMFNYKTFDVWNKPLNSSLTINWKITF